jgi:predicted DNA repair protein MutK
MESLLHGLGATMNFILPTLFNAIIGIIAGILALGSVTAIKRLA